MEKESKIILNNVCHSIACNDRMPIFNGSCYLIATERRDLHTARNKCESMGSHLVYFETREEQRFLSHGLLRDSGFGYWIGLENGSNGTFVWMDGTSIQFRNFGKEHGGNICFRLSAGTWHGVPCSSKCRYICERSIGQYNEKTTWRNSKYM